MTMNPEESKRYLEIVSHGNMDQMADFCYEKGVRDSMGILESYDTWGYEEVARSALEGLLAESPVDGRNNEE